MLHSKQKPKNMKCFICDNSVEYSFSKKFNEFDLETVDYFSCINCGFTLSKNHIELSEAKWTTLNNDWHAENNLKEQNPWNRDQRYFQQSMMIYLLHRFKIITGEKFLDWGSGEGGFSKKMYDLFSLKINAYDKFIKPTTFPLPDDQLIKQSFDFVINNAVFEHVTNRETLNEINSYVSHQGVLAIHTLVRERIPKDPDWMYLLPVHSCFHTNKSMDILMKQWGYTCSVYNENAKLWVMFKTDQHLIADQIKQVNMILGFDYFKFKAGFMDYWKD